MIEFIEWLQKGSNGLSTLGFAVIASWLIKDIIRAFRSNSNDNE